MSCDAAGPSRWNEGNAVHDPVSDHDVDAVNDFEEVR